MINEASVLYKMMLYNTRTMLCSILCIVGVIGFVFGSFSPPSPAMPFLLIAVVGFTGYGLEFWSRHQKGKILAGGCSVMGKVSKVVCSKFTNFHTSTFHVGNEDALHPYTVYFTYTVDGISYMGHSSWHWYRPVKEESNPINVFYDKKHPAQYALKGL